MKPTRDHFLAVTAGIFLGAAATVSPGAVFILFLAAGTAFGLHRFSRREDRRFLVGLFLAGFLLRLFLSVALDLGSVLEEGTAPARTGPVREWSLGIRDTTREYLRMGDSDYYSQRAFAFAKYLEGNREPVVVFRLNQYGWNAYVDLMGMFYYVFGFSPIAVKGLNWFLGAWLGLLVFLILRERFHRQIAKWSAVAVAFFPSIIFWSVSNLKDVSLIFLTLLSVWLFARLEQAREIRVRLRYGVLLVSVLVLHGLVREGLFLMLGASFLAAWILTRLRISRQILWPGMGAAIGLAAWLVSREPFGIRIRSMLVQLFHKHTGYVTSNGMTYAFLPSDFYRARYSFDWVQSGRVDGAILYGMAKALGHFFMEPLPGKFDRPIHLLGLPQMVVWYGILFFALVGAIVCLRRDARKVLFLFLPTVSLSFVMALTCGNVGTLFRVRDLVTPFILSFACFGFWVSCYGSEGAFAGSAEVPVRDAIQGSFLERQFSKSWNKVRAWTARWRKEVPQVYAEYLAGLFSKRLGILLTTAVLANGLGTLLLRQGWSPWSTGFRIGILGLGLWALRTPSDWKSLKEGSKIRILHEPDHAS